jgi:hypothetical protein
VIGIDIGKNSFHVVGHDARGAIVLRGSDEGPHYNGPLWFTKRAIICWSELTLLVGCSIVVTDVPELV